MTEVMTSGNGSHITDWSRPMMCGSKKLENVLKAGKVLKKEEKLKRPKGK